MQKIILKTKFIFHITEVNQFLLISSRNILFQWYHQFKSISIFIWYKNRSSKKCHYIIACFAWNSSQITSSNCNVILYATAPIRIRLTFKISLLLTYVVISKRRIKDRRIIDLFYSITRFRKSFGASLKLLQIKWFLRLNIDFNLSMRSNELYSTTLMSLSLV